MGSNLGFTDEWRPGADTAVTTIWLDVTTFMNWKYSPVGIVRVEEEVARAVAQAPESKFKFCYYNFGRGFQEVSRDSFLGKQKILREVATVVESAPRNTTSVVSSAKSLARNLISSLPRSIQEPAWRFAKSRYPAVKKGGTALWDLKDSLKDFVVPVGRAKLEAKATQHEGRAVFAEGDVYISVGLDWDDKDLDYLYSLKKKVGFKVVLMCHDIIPILLPHLCVQGVAEGMGRHFANLAWCADAVICNSAQTESDFLGLVREMRTPIPDTRVVKLAGSMPDHKESALGEEVLSASREPYILYVSTFEPRKNHDLLYKVCVKLEKLGAKSPRFVCVGKGGWGVNDLLDTISRDARVRDRFIQLRAVSDEELSYLYRHSLFAVFPSIYEGWGLGLSEALSFGKYAIASDTGALREVGGALIEYIDPWDVDGWTKRIRELCENPQVLAELESRVASEYASRSWDIVGKEILSYAADVVGA